MTVSAIEIAAAQGVGRKPEDAYASNNRQNRLFALAMKLPCHFSRSWQRIHGDIQQGREACYLPKFTHSTYAMSVNNMIPLPITRCCAIIGLFCVLDQSVAFAESQGASGTEAVTDFVDFWAASRLLITGGNPFSPSEVLALQQSVGYGESKPLLMWNPPWTLSFILPFGAMDFQLSRFCWLLMNVFFILLSAQKLWAIYGQPERKSYLPGIVAFTFVPTLMVLIIGQISPLILLGIVGFLHFERKNQLFLAGVSTVIISVKPHLFYLFWLGLILWVWQERRCQVAFGAMMAGFNRCHPTSDYRSGGISAVFPYAPIPRANNAT